MENKKEFVKIVLHTNKKKRVNGNQYRPVFKVRSAKRVYRDIMFLGRNISSYNNRPLFRV
ncbi:MAG: hypothetical protein PUB21_11845 [Bacteroidales bacterium]|nr:hypothetical protein [Bacteroidales bacterium]